jgi:hypothetical protein
MDANGLVTPCLVRFPVGGQEKPRGLPAGLPIGLGQLDLAAVLTALVVAITVNGHIVAQLGQPATTPAHRHPPLGHPLVDLDQLGQETLQPALLLKPFRLGGVPARAAQPGTNWDS